jgi:hypothetical protein
MAEIAQLDHAWEAVNALGGAGQDALRAIEQLGGKDPRQRVRDAAEHMLAELKRLYEQSGDQITASIIAEAEPRFELSCARPAVRIERVAQVGLKTPNTSTITDLVRAYKDDPDSKYGRLRHGTRGTYDSLLRRIDREIGTLAVSDITPQDYIGWHTRWCANGRTSIAHSLVATAKQLFSYGSDVLYDDDCSRFLGTIRGIHFTPPKPRKRGVTVEQANAIRAKAHKMERPSIALAQAFQFELKFGQGEVIGEWVPQSEPGASDVMNDDEKWLRGIRWSEIDARLILRHTVLTRNGEKEIEVDLKRMPMVMEELSKLGKRPASGPVVICEWSGIPWTSHEFRRWWRKVADACGIPKTVYNMDSRERRTGADTAASDDDISDEGRPGSSNDHARRLIEKIRALLRQLSPEQEQGDVIHDIALDIHSGKISEADICPKLCRRYVTEHYKRYNSRYNTVSLDQPLPGTDNQKLGDLISSEHNVWNEARG